MYSFYPPSGAGVGEIATQHHHQGSGGQYGDGDDGQEDEAEHLGHAGCCQHLPDQLCGRWVQLCGQPGRVLSCAGAQHLSQRGDVLCDGGDGDDGGDGVLYFSVIWFVKCDEDRNPNINIQRQSSWATSTSDGSE